jgi:preprotein translocase subunit YajC
VSVVTLLPFIVLIGAMVLMTRSAKRKQAAAASMRNEMQPGAGVRTIGGMYATVKEVHDEMVLLEVAPGVHAVYAKNAVATVLDDAEYNRIVHGDVEEEVTLDAPVVPDDASSLIESSDAPSDSVDLGKKPGADLTKRDAGAKDATGPESGAAEDAAKAAGESKAPGEAKATADTKAAADAKDASEAKDAEASEAKSDTK